jgi:16S rRNA (cytosine967-C5)-methyltransferase
MAPHHSTISSTLPQRQLAILRSALAQVAPGGRLIYSTCSLEKEENENVVEQALSQNKSFRLLDCRSELNRLKESGELTWPELTSLTSGPYLRTIPGVHPCDGFFAAILERNVLGCWDCGLKARFGGAALYP